MNVQAVEGSCLHNARRLGRKEQDLGDKNGVTGCICVYCDRFPISFGKECGAVGDGFEAECACIIF
jgi:hypothetical protein